MSALFRAHNILCISRASLNDFVIKNRGVFSPSLSTLYAFAFRLFGTAKLVKLYPCQGKRAFLHDFYDTLAHELRTHLLLKGPSAHQAQNEAPEMRQGQRMVLLSVSSVTLLSFDWNLSSHVRRVLVLLMHIAWKWEGRVFRKVFSVCSESVLRPSLHFAVRDREHDSLFSQLVPGYLH